MSDFAIFSIVWLITAFIWVVVLVVYSSLIESFDFGHLPSFAAKSAALVTTVTLVLMYVPFGGLLSLGVWYLGLVSLFKMDPWECKYLVFLVWAVRFAVGWALQGLLLSGR